MTLRTVAALSGAVILIGTTFALGSVYGAHQVRERDEWVDGRLLSTAIDSVQANALDSLPSEELVKRAVSGMLRELQDPYAALLRADGYQRYRGSLRGEGQGFGLVMRTQAGVTSVARVIPGSPAAAAGLRAGDRIASVNAIPVSAGWGRFATDTSSAPLDTARLVVWRAMAADSLRVDLRRTPWHTTAVFESGMLTDSVAYVRLGSITSRAVTELEDAVDALRRRGARALVLDLRGNGGGLFEQGVNVAGLFLPRGTVVASLTNRGSSPEMHRGTTSRWPTMPLAVLVDAGTASAAEVIAAGLREHNRALLVGSPTFGKGVVQRVVRLTPELSLRLTTARWLTPSGMALQRRQGAGKDARGGLTPDVLLEDASRTDQFAFPKSWSPSVIAAVSTIADSVAVGALRDGWLTTPVESLERRVRADLDAVRRPRGVGKTDWTAVATRVATARTLEFRGDGEGLLRLSSRGDEALRAGLDVVAPGMVVTGQRASGGAGFPSDARLRAGDSARVVARR